MTTTSTRERIDDGLIENRQGHPRGAGIFARHPTTVIDRASFEQPARYSEGIRDVMVGGVFVVRDEKLMEGVKPGKAVRRTNR